MGESSTEAEKLDTGKKRSPFESLHQSLDQVLIQEDNCLEKRRNLIAERDKVVPEPLIQTRTGVAFSGGGIRSASVCLGAVKVLEEKGILEKADYLSSVSGGGYANAYVQATLHNGAKSLLDDEFMTNMMEGGADYMSARSKIIPSRLIPSKLVSLLNIMGTILIGLLNPMIFFGTIILTWFIAMSILIDVFPFVQGADLRNYLVLFIKPLVLILITGMIGYYFFGSTIRLRVFQLVNIIGAYLLGLLLIAFALSYTGSLFNATAVWIEDFKQLSTSWIEDVLNLGFTTRRIWLGLIFLTLFSLATYIIFSAPMRWLIGHFSRIVIPKQITKWGSFFRYYQLTWNIALGLISVVVLIIVLGANPALTNEWFAFRLLCLIVLLGFFTNINLISIGRIYGDSLANAFGIDKSLQLTALSRFKRERSKNDPKTNAFSYLFNRRKGDDSPSQLKAPYPLFNCCLNLASQSGTSNLTADYFLLSPKHMGSAATGYVEPGGIALTRAMTTSAAAVNTGMGIFSSSITSILIGLFNFRMGSLLYNPRKHKGLIETMKRSRGTVIDSVFYSLLGLAYLRFTSSFTWWPWYYLKSLLARNTLEDTLLDISDGGHIENLAVFELLRRKCKLIIGIDAGMDAKYEFEDLKNLIKRANKDLDIEINFRPGYNPFVDIKPSPDAYGVSKRRYGIADIQKYKRTDGEIEEQDGKKVTEHIGTYVYIKSSLLQDLATFPEEEEKENGKDTVKYKVYKYKKFNSDFPHHSTADQSFEPIQFQAYYELGQSLCQDIFDDLQVPLEKSFTREDLIGKFEEIIGDEKAKQEKTD